MYLQAECVLIFKCCFTSESCAAACEALRNAYPDKEVPNQTNYYKDVTTAH